MSTTPRRIRQYELQQLLGSGSVGEVWKSYDLQYRRDVAIKIFYSDLQSDPNFLERLRTQGQLLASLHHPNIVRILDAHVTRSREANGTIAYMVMEYIQGITLADSIQNTSHRGIFPAVSDIVSLFTQLAAAIDYAHEHDIIHGNIKPANILLKDSRHEETRETASSPVATYGEPVLVDFGIIRSTNRSTRNSALYISPEQARGLHPTRHSDIYSLGVILYEICAGVPPFRSENPAVLMMQHTQMQPISPTLINSNIPSELSAVILRALSKDPATSFSSASQMATALADACSEPIELNKTTVEAKRPDPIPNRNRVTMHTTSTEASSARMPIPSSLVRNTRLISTWQAQGAAPTGVAMLPAHAASAYPPNRVPWEFQSRQAQGTALTEARFNTSRPLAVIPNGSSRGGNNVPHPAAYHFRSSSTSITGEFPVQADTRSPIPFSTALSPTETPPAMPVIPSSWVSAPLISSPTVMQRPLALPPPKKVTRLAPLYTLLSITLLLVIAGTMLGMLFWIHSQSATPSSTVAGHIYFQNDSFGQNDVLRIEMQNIPNPASGKSYVAWLVVNEQGNSPTPTFLGTLHVSSGRVNFLYPGNANHSDLLANASGLLITEEDANSTPSFPSSKVIYTVAFAQSTQSAGTPQLSTLDSLRDLLSDTQALNQLGISGGLAEWLLRDTSKIWLWASNARDYWQGTNTNSSALNLARGQVVHIVDVLEGKQLDASDAPITRVALLQQNATAPDYLDASISSLNAIASAKDATTDQKARAHTILQELQSVKSWLQGVHQDATQLLNLTNSQFIQPSTQSLLEDLAMQATLAYNGQNDLSANSAQHPGMAEIYTDIQRLATFDVIPLKTS